MYLYKWPSHNLLTIWEALLKVNLTESTQLSTFAHVNVKNYFIHKLTAMIHANITESKRDALSPDWLPEKVKAYQNETAETGVIMHPKLCYPEILNASVHLFPACTYFSPEKDSHCVWRKVSVWGAWNLLCEAHETNSPFIFTSEGVWKIICGRRSEKKERKLGKKTRMHLSKKFSTRKTLTTITIPEIL